MVGVKMQFQDGTTRVRGDSAVEDVENDRLIISNGNAITGKFKLSEVAGWYVENEE